MKKLHRFFSRLGISLGGHKSCLKYDCKDYCGFMPSEHHLFYMAKFDIWFPFDSTGLDKGMSKKEN